MLTFLAVYRCGSVTDGAGCRGITQPAASQQLGALERCLGEPVFVRQPGGVEPTQRGRELYAEAADCLDQLHSVLGNLAGGSRRTPEPPVRFGSSAEYFAAELIPRLGEAGVGGAGVGGAGFAVSARFGTDPELFALLGSGELDVVVTSSAPPRRSMVALPIGSKRFVLVAAPRVAPTPAVGSLSELGEWLVGRAWASFSLELPLTRRFWQAALGRPFGARLVLVAPDLRAVLKAVELGIGVSLLPTFVCSDALASGRLLELFPVGQLVPEEPWFACTRQGDLHEEKTRPGLAAMMEVLVAATTGLAGISLRASR